MREEGRCLCGEVVFAATGDPVRITQCYCRFCQRATGSIVFREPIFLKEAFEIADGSPKVFSLMSEGSGKRVNVHFCDACGTKIYLSFERFPDVVGVYGGAFDDPDWYMARGVDHRCIFLDFAPRGAIVPAGIKTYREHVQGADGATNEATVFDAPHTVGDKS
ncbi:MAG: GFA family protein [Pseudomonadota bacterium]